jgi:hypothetical protein
MAKMSFSIEGVVVSANRQGGRSSGGVGVMLPVRTLSEPNSRRHWAKASKMSREQRTAFAMNVKAVAWAVRFPCVVTLTRFTPGSEGLDDDNLPPALKHCRDGVADGLGFDDSRKAPITWRYAEVTGADDYAVRAEITWRGGDC